MESALRSTAASPSIDDSKKGRSRLTNGSAFLPGGDGRSTWTRRAKDLLRSFIIDLGGPADVSTAEAALARRCAVLVAQAERLEAAFAECEGKADNADLDAYLKTANTLRRLLQTLGLKRRPRDVGLTLSQYIADKYKRDEAAP